MTEREKLTLLKDNGFYLQRRASKGEIWSDGNSTVMAPFNGSKVSVRTQKNFLADVKRAISMRPMAPAPTICKSTPIIPMPPKKEKEIVIEKQEQPKRPFATLGDAVKAQAESKSREEPKEHPKKQLVKGQPISQDDATEYAKSRREEGATYDEIIQELTNLGYVQFNGKPYAASHLSLIVVSKYPHMRSRKHKVKAAIPAILMPHPAPPMPPAPVVPPVQPKPIVVTPNNVAPAMNTALDIIQAVKRLNGLDDANRKTIISILVDLI